MTDISRENTFTKEKVRKLKEFCLYHSFDISRTNFVLLFNKSDLTHQLTEDDIKTIHIDPIEQGDIKFMNWFIISVNNYENINRIFETIMSEQSNFILNKSLIDIISFRKRNITYSYDFFTNLPGYNEKDLKVIQINKNKYWDQKPPITTAPPTIITPPPRERGKRQEEERKKEESVFIYVHLWTILFKRYDSTLGDRKFP